MGALVQVVAFLKLAIETRDLLLELAKTCERRDLEKLAESVRARDSGMAAGNAAHKAARAAGGKHHEKD